MRASCRQHLSTNMATQAAHPTNTHICSACALSTPDLAACDFAAAFFSLFRSFFLLACLCDQCRVRDGMCTICETGIVCTTHLHPRMVTSPHSYLCTICLLISQLLICHPLAVCCICLPAFCICLSVCSPLFHSSPAHSRPHLAGHHKFDHCPDFPVVLHSKD